MMQSNKLHDSADSGESSAEPRNPQGIRSGNTTERLMGRRRSDVMVMPYSAEHVTAAIELATRIDVAIIPLGAGTNPGDMLLSQGGLLISTERMDRIIELDVSNQRVTVQAGVINSNLARQLQSHGYQFAPDPVVQQSSTIGGNIATNSGGTHSLKYGLTTDHVLALEVVLYDGTVRWMGDDVREAAGYDLVGLMVGSGGTLGVVTRALLHLVRAPEASRMVLALLPDLKRANAIISAVLNTGYLPTSLEILDANAIRAMNQTYRLELPTAAGALLLIKFDGVADGLDELLDEVTRICEQHDALEVRRAHDITEQNQIWDTHRHISGALQAHTPGYFLVDTVMPDIWLPSMVEQVQQLAQKYSMPMGRSFQAGDGTLRPVVLCNARDPRKVQHAHALATEMMQMEIEQIDTFNGMQGIGVKHQDLVHLLLSAAELDTMAALYAVFSPNGRFHPTRIFPPGSDPLHMAARRQERIAANQGTLSRDQLAAALVQTVGQDSVLAAEAATAYRVQDQTPTLAVLPDNLDELSATLALCHRAGASVVPWGGGTQQDMGAVPHPVDVVLVTSRLNQIIKYDPDALSIEVGSGTTLNAINALLAAHQQMLPVDVPHPAEATIGGLIATAVEGPRRVGYGTLRELLIGMTIVEVDGTVVRNGAQVVKNVQGYDLAKLFHGSHGTLGVIASVTLKTLPRPRAAATALLLCATRQQVLALARALTATALTPTAVEYLDTAALHATGIELYAPATCALAVRAEGTAAACARHLADLRDLARQYECHDMRDLRDATHEHFWAQVSNLTSTRRSHPDEALLRVAVPPAALPAALEQLTSCADALGLRYTVHVRALNGIIYTRVWGAASSLHTLHHDMMTRWQHSHVLSCDPARKDTLPLWGAAPANLDLMRAIKQVFDPAHTLNPGRYII